MKRTVGTCQAPRLRGGRSIEVRPVGRDGERKAGDCGDDSRELPASQDDRTDSRAEHIVSMAKGKLIGEALLKVQLAVIVKRGIVSTPVDIELESAIVVVDVTHGFAPGKGRSEGETV